MLERNFQKGFRVIWKCPSPISKDLKGEVFTVPAKAGEMTYDGEPGLRLLGKARGLGLKKGGKISFSWLDYIEGSTPKTNTADDVLTGPMSGCPIATWTDKGGSWVAHLGTMVDRTEVNNLIKNEFSKLMKTDARDALVYSPMKVWIDDIPALQLAFKKPLPTPYVFCLVTSSKKVYSILMFRLADYKNVNWIIEGYREVAPLRGQQLSDALKPK